MRDVLQNTYVSTLIPTMPHNVSKLLVSSNYSEILWFDNECDNKNKINMYFLHTVATHGMIIVVNVDN